MYTHSLFDDHSRCDMHAALGLFCSFKTDWHILASSVLVIYLVATVF